MFSGIANKIASRPSKPTATVPGEVVGVDGGGVQNGITYINIFPGTYDGGSPIIEYRFYFDGILIAPDTVSGESYSWNQDLSGSSLDMSAVNAIGEGPISYGIFYVS